MCVARWLFVGQSSSPGSSQGVVLASILASSVGDEDSDYGGGILAICFEDVHEEVASRHTLTSGFPVAQVRP